MMGGSLAYLLRMSSTDSLPQMCSGRMGVHICSMVPRGSEHFMTTVWSSGAVTDSMCVV